MSASNEALARFGKPSLKRNRSLITKFPVPNFDIPATQWRQFNARKDVGQRFLEDMVAVSRVHHEWPQDVQCYNERNIAGTTTPSLHSWGIAFDVFGRDERDPKTSSRLMSRKWCLSIEELGWRWGGRWKNADPHHFEEIL